MPTVDQAATLVLAELAKVPGRGLMAAADLAAATGLDADDINDAVTLLVEDGLAEWLRTLGTAPFEFSEVRATSRGRYAYEQANTGAAAVSTVAPALVHAVTPVGSPFGFEDEDWETVDIRKHDSSTLHVVFGLQFVSEHYDTATLRDNVEMMFAKAVASYAQLRTALPVRLEFRALTAGYGGHLFNEIARDIISADIATFDTSDLNPNVMVEIGVALTWGVRVLLLKQEGCPKPPSDISGQTWADFRDSGGSFVEPDHEKRLVAMVERAVRKKSRTSRA